MPRRNNAGRTPMRMCVICRAKLPKHELKRYVCPRNGAEPMPDPDQTLPGRGFYLCPDETCGRRFGKYKGWRKKCQEVKSGREQASG